jgi:hypothetical protein
MPLPACRSAAIFPILKGGIDAQKPRWGRQIEPHDHSELGIKAMICFGFAGLSDPGADFGLGQESEAEMLIQRAIPWNVPEGCERERRQVRRDRPGLDLLDQGAAHPVSLVAGCDEILVARRWSNYRQPPRGHNQYQRPLSLAAGCQGSAAALNV